MNLPLNFLPEIVSLFAGLLSSLTFLKARKVVKHYSFAMSQLEKIESLEKAAAELADLRIEIERNPEESLVRNEKSFVKFLDGLGDIVSEETTRLDDVHGAIESINLILEGSSKYSREQIDEMRANSVYVDELIRRRKTIASQITADLSAIRDFVGQMKLKESEL